MNEAILGGLIGTGGTILGVIVTQVFELKKKKYEEKTWYLNYFLERKFKTLTAEHVSEEKYLYLFPEKIEATFIRLF